MPLFGMIISRRGMIFHHLLITPAVERLLELQPGEAELDVPVAMGLWRASGRPGGQVTACDVSAVFLERARARRWNIAAKSVISGRCHR
jgi:hypothetical protein